MSHPLRRRLLDVSTVRGPSTVTALAEATGARVHDVSHHVEVLARAELVVETPERARDRRERWWALAAPSLRWSSQDFQDDPVGAAVAQAALSLDLDRHVALVREWYATEQVSDEQREHWQGTAFSTDKWLHLTPEELAQLSQEVIGVLNRWVERDVPDDGGRREPVAVFTYGVPATP